MAIYGADLYGLAKYGSRKDVDYDVSPFAAFPASPTEVNITWTEPVGSWERLRLVKSWAGFPATADDGKIILDIEHSIGQHLDTEVVGGRFAFYAIFLRLGPSAWFRAAITSTLMVRDFRSADWLWDKIPNYYRYTGKDLSALTTSPENEHLRAFVDVLGWGLDYQRTLAGTLAHAYDARLAHITNVARLAEMLGLPAEPGTSGRLLRLRAANASVVHRQRGTVEGLRHLIKISTGWDADIQVSRNLMLDDDQSNFLHPQYPLWSPAINYAEGERVKHVLYWFQAKPGGAFGEAQKPPTGQFIDNTWWTALGHAESEFALNPETGGQYTWEAYDPASGDLITSYLRLGSGVESPTNAGLYAKNALVIRNFSAATADVVVRSVSRLSGQPGMDPMQPIKHGIPVPTADVQWTPDRNYRIGEFALYNGMPYQAVVGVPRGGDPPPQAPRLWRRKGLDSRVAVMLSGYTHQAFTLDWPAVQVYPFIEWYDEQGELIVKATGDLPHALDTFTVADRDGTLDSPAPNADLDGRKLEYFGATRTWSVVQGAWVRDGYRGGVARPADPSAASTAVVAGTAADVRVSATFRTAGLAPLVQGLVFRYSDPGNYWRVTRTGVAKKVAGVWQGVGAALTDPIGDGDRVTVALSGTSIKVYRNGTEVYSATDSFNQTASAHGMTVES